MNPLFAPTSALRAGWLALLLLAGLLGSGPAAGQGIDCTKARTRPEKAICASAGLRQLDRAVGDAYAAAVARQPGQAAEMRLGALSWLRARDAACVGSPPAGLAQCLAGQMTRRLAELSPPANASAPSPTPSPTLGPVLVMREPSVPSAANPAPASAVVVPARFRAGMQVDLELQVASPGRFIIAARSRTGVAVQLVDMLTGPSATMGEAGVHDGRLDVLLDAGAYRVRAFAAAGVDEEVSLSVQPFRDAAPPRAFLPAGESLSAELGDGEQRAFWLLVPPSGLVDIEAAGRALADLRLWRDGRELTALVPEAGSIEPQASHPMTDLRLSGSVEPGVYLAIAYGGPSLPWTDGRADRPFHVRTGVSGALGEGWAGGAIGPFGSERYAAPGFAGTFRLDLPRPDAAQLLAGGQVAAIARTSREPSARISGTPGRMGVVEVRAAAGQAFTLRAIEAPGGMTVARQGTYWVSAIALGAGGDEAPATVLLERLDGQDPPRVVAGNVPRLAPGTTWTGRFNLRGPTALLFETPQGGSVSVRTTGLSLRGDPGAESRTELPAGYSVVRLSPVPGAQGAVEVAVGAGPGGVAAAPAPLPPDPVIPLGLQAVGPRQSLRLSAQTAPGISTGLSARPVPVALAEGPLTVTQPAGGPPVAIPVQIAAGGALWVTALGGVAVPVTLDGSVVTVPGADRARTVVLAWRPAVLPAPDIPAPRAPGSTTELRAGEPVAFDLARGEQRGFALAVAQGGLFRIETTGRLHTAGRLATALLPQLGADEAGGVGENMLMQTFLRAGRYRVDVAAKGSAGHLAVVAGPAPLAAGAALVPGGSVRASLPAGSGIVFPVRIETEGRYHLDLAGLGRPFVARLEDAEGWPVTVPGDLSSLDQALRPGTYRLLVSPDAVARQVIARLVPLRAAVAIVGHGPHPLPFATPQSATWREPPGRGEARTPDAWSFALAGPAEVTLAIGDGMVAELRPVPDAVDRPLARTTRRWTGRLEAGSYRVSATSLGRNDRLDYTLGLTARQLQPDQVLSTTLPASIPFSLATARVASLTTWGTTPLKAVLRRQDGSEVARGGARVDDWNVALSRLLPAGSYVLELAAASPPGGTAAVPQDPGVAAAPTEEPASDEGDRADDGQSGQSLPDRREASGERADDGDAAEQRVEVRLALPSALPPVAASSAALTGAGVHVLDVPPVPAGALVLAQASGDGTTVLALERQDGDGWRTVALDQGRTALVAALGDGDARRWRIEAWSVDGDAVPVRIAVRLLDTAAEAAPEVMLRAVDGMDVGAARVRLDGAGVLAVGSATQVAAWPGHAAERVEDGQAVAQGSDAWLIGPPGAARVAPFRIEAGASRVVSLPPGSPGVLPAIPPAAGRLLLWRAESGLGQPGLQSGGLAPGIAPGSVLAEAAEAATLRNAGGGEAMRARASLLDLALLAPLPPGALMLPPHSATPVLLDGAGEATVTLAAGVAALGEGASAWAAEEPLTRSLAVGGRLLLVNTGAAAAAASVAWTGGVLPAVLRPGDVFKRFFGAAGSFDRAVEAGGRLAVAGDAELMWLGADGQVRRGRTLDADGPGHVVVTHAPGAVVLSLAAPGASPWARAEPQAVSLPASLPLAGAALALSFAPDAPALLHAATTAPVLLGLGDAPPELFAAGAEFHRAIPAGPMVLRLYSPHDGPLSGTIALSAEPLRPAAEGLGATVAVAPGHAAAFAFSLARPAHVGIGVRAVPDRVAVRLLDGAGAVLGEGVAQLRPLPAGRYVIEARVPPDAPASLVRPALAGITPRGNGPPAEIARRYLELVGLGPADATTTEPVR